MKEYNIIENVDLILDEADKPFDKAKFIISNIYYFIRTFYHYKYIDSNFEQFENYLNSFKNKFHKKSISDTLSFNLMNKSSNINDPKDNIYSKEEKTKGEIYYDLLYNRLINIIIEGKYNNKEDFIESIISLRNCFIFLEYLYLLLKEYPNLINHYIIKLDITLLLNIPERVLKKLINSNEFFYLNLIELKGLFPEIKYSTSSFIDSFDELFKFEYIAYINSLKFEKLISLKYLLSKLIESLEKINSKKCFILLEDLRKKLENLSKDLFAPKWDNDELIKKYILSSNNLEKKRLNQILNEINDDNNIIPNFNYLYLIALNIFNEIKESKDNNEIINNENDIDENKKNIIMSNVNQKNILNKNENIIINISETEKVDDALKQEQENLIEREELILKIRPIKGNILGLKYEETKEYKDKYEKLIERNFTFSRVLNLMNDNIYNILFLIDIYKQKERDNSIDIDNAYIENKNEFISFIENINSINYKQFYEVISDKNFHEEIITILKSKPIKEYIITYMDYDENKNKEIYLESFTQEYNKLMENLNDSLFFIGLFRLKYLPFGVKAIVNYNLKIIINSLYYKFSEKIEESNKIILLRAAFRILIINEIIHILKYLTNEVILNKLQKAEKMLINYLFNISTIKRINLEQALKINDSKNWNDINILKKIFADDNEQIEKESYIKNNDYLEIYFTEDDVEDGDIKIIKIYEDIGIDID